MGPIFYVMAILGCGDGQAACEQVRLVEAHYAGAEACAAAMPTVLSGATDLSFPEVTAECRPAGAKVAAAARPTKG